MENNSTLIFGFSKVAKQIAHNLKLKNKKFVVVESNQVLCEKIKKQDIEVINLDLTNDEDMKQVGIQNAKTLFCAHSDNDLNLFVTLSARSFNSDLKIIAKVDDIDEEKKMFLAGANKIISPYDVAGHRIFRLLNKPIVLDICDNILFSKTDIKVVEIQVSKESSLNGVYIKDIDIEQKYNIIVVGVLDFELKDEFTFHSSGVNHKVDEHDIVVVMGYEEDIVKFKKECKL
jgi:voltage-gated potassium channel